MVEDICSLTISTMKVDWPRAISSEAPMRVKMRSTRPMRAESAGTNDPIWAISTIMATCRIHVDLPAMLGPVRITIAWSVDSWRHWA